ncbi:MAG: hypothetical protein H6843_09480 [Rhodospirillaceae bacterium]|nr:hypothetical protein [Rhodospirillaceae bacterium]
MADGRTAGGEPRARDAGTAYRRVREEADRPAQSGRTAAGSQAGEGAVMRLPQSTWEVLSGHLASPGLTIERHEWVARAYRSAANAGRTAPSSRLADLSI